MPQRASFADAAMLMMLVIAADTLFRRRLLRQRLRCIAITLP